MSRAARLPGRRALVLHLSRMAPPGPRPHHSRIARAVLDEAAFRDEGEVFALRNTDLVLLRRGADEALPGVLARLFHADVPDPAHLLSHWCAAADNPALLAYAAARLGDRPAPLPLPDPPAPAGAADAVAELVHGTALTDLTRQQTAVDVRGGRLEPLFREWTFSAAVLSARLAAAGPAGADPWLFRHIAPRLDARMLHALRHAPPRGAVPLHVNLSVPGILSDAFAPFATACQGVVAGVEVPLVEACADPRAFALARDRLRLAGMAFVLDNVSHHALLLTVPMALGPDLVKLDWHPTMAEAGPALDRALDALGPGRVVLSRAGHEAALAWGMARGIRRFQGRHVDAVLAAQRVRACAHGSWCSVRQCSERATATGPGGRAGCLNPALLDRAVP